MDAQDPGEKKTSVNRPAIWKLLPIELARMTTQECAVVLSGPRPTVILPVGSTEPHGPHLPLATDVILAEESARRAASKLREEGVAAVVAPSVAYGVTRFASGFAGAISVSAALVEQLVRELCVAYREAGFAMVCVTNHHLEPEHVAAVARAVDGTCAVRGGVRFANPLAPRWGRTLSQEFRRGDCHAGSYETSLVMAAREDLVHEGVRKALPPVKISLSDAIRSGKTSFREIGLERAYCGAPAEASRQEGEELYQKLVNMIVTEVMEGLQETGVE